MNTQESLRKIQQWQTQIQARRPVSGAWPAADIAKVRTLLNSLMEQKWWSATIALARLCPAALDVPTFVKACEMDEPLMLDEVLDFPGVDTSTVQLSMVKNLPFAQATVRLNRWYPDAIPQPLAEQWVSRLYNTLMPALQDGPSHRRVLADEQGRMLLQALQWVPHRIQHTNALLPIYRVAHYVLRGLEREQPLEHAVDPAFAKEALESLWRAVSVNKDMLPHALALTAAHGAQWPEMPVWMQMTYPQHYPTVQQVWGKSNKDVQEWLKQSPSHSNTPAITSRKSYDWLSSPSL